MGRSVNGSQSTWRRLTACALAAALVLQGIAFSLAGARVAADTASDLAAATAWAGAGFELCRHDGGTTPGAPADPAADGSHCVFCLAGGTFVLGAPEPAPAYRVVLAAPVSWPLTAWRLPTPTVDASARPRGPPTAA